MRKKYLTIAVIALAVVAAFLWLQVKLTHYFDPARQKLTEGRLTLQQWLTEDRERIHSLEAALKEPELRSDSMRARETVQNLIRTRWSEANIRRRIDLLDELSAMLRDFGLFSLFRLPKLNHEIQERLQRGTAIVDEKPKISAEEVERQVVQVLSRYNKWDQHFGALISRYNTLLNDPVGNIADLPAFSARLRVLADSFSRLSTELQDVDSLCDTQAQRALVDEFRALLAATQDAFSYSAEVGVTLGRDYTKASVVWRYLGRVAKGLKGDPFGQVADTSQELEAVGKLAFTIKYKVAEVESRIANWKRSAQRFIGTQTPTIKP